MHPRTLELLRHLDTQMAALRAAVEAMPAGQRTMPPGPGRWSAAQVLEHLATVEAQVAALLQRGLRQALANGPVPPDPDHGAVLPTIDAERLLDRERRVAAPAAALPAKGLTPDEAWRALEAARVAVRAVLLAADGLQTSAIRAPHPSLGELTFHQWIAFLGYHTARHAAQIRAAAAGLAGT